MSRLSPAEIREMRLAAEQREAADEECALAFGHAEELAGLLDRHPGTAGRDADAIASIGIQIMALSRELRLLIGEPPEVIRNSDGEVVGLIRKASRR